MASDEVLSTAQVGMAIGVLPWKIQRLATEGKIHPSQVIGRQGCSRSPNPKTSALRLPRAGPLHRRPLPVDLTPDPRLTVALARIKVAWLGTHQTPQGPASITRERGRHSVGQFQRMR